MYSNKSETRNKREELGCRRSSGVLFKALSRKRDGAIEMRDWNTQPLDCSAVQVVCPFCVEDTYIL
jgi:hypothetical protein